MDTANALAERVAGIEESVRIVLAAIVKGLAADDLSVAVVVCNVMRDDLRAKAAELSAISPVAADTVSGFASAAAQLGQAVLTKLEKRNAPPP